MIFRQLFDKTSSTYTYLLASRNGGEALLIDPVLEQTGRYLKLLEELDLKLVKVIDTHIHADHVSAMGKLRDATRCVTVMGEQSPTDVVSMRVSDNEKLTIEGLTLTALHTPGHTRESYNFLMDDRVFTGDTLLIRGTGRTDFQKGVSETLCMGLAHAVEMGHLLNRSGYKIANWFRAATHSLTHRPVFSKLRIAR